MRHFFNGENLQCGTLEQTLMSSHFDMDYVFKGLARLGNTVAETLFPVMFPRWLN